MDRLRAKSDQSKSFAALFRAERVAAPPRKSGEADVRPRAKPDASNPVARALERAHAENPRLNCFLDIFDDALAPVDGRPAASPHLPLHGLPFAYKDVFRTPRRIPTVGVGEGYSWPGQYESVVVHRLLDAGAVAIGALNLDPHCYTATGFNRYFGRARNPCGQDFAIGGSSSGAAAAVAAGIVPFALGTDTGGSVRIPASLCGVLGFKPSYRALPDDGVAALSSSQDSVGILAADIATLTCVFRVLTSVSLRGGLCSAAQSPAPDPSVPQREPSDRVIVGIDQSGLLAGLDEEVRVSVAESKAAMKRSGATIVDIAFPSVDDLNTCASVVTGFEVARSHLAAMVSQPSHYPAPVRRRLLTAACVSGTDYRLALNLRAVFLMQVLDEVFIHADFIVLPTLRKIAPNVSGIAEDDVEIAGAISLEFLRMNRPISYLGLPAISVPVGRDRNGIPIGLQIVARPNEDHSLLKFVQHLIRAAVICYSPADLMR